MTANVPLPVLIVGGGPTGLTLALECCRHQVPFRIIDQNSVRSPYSKALGIWHGTVQVLEAQGVLAEFLAAGMRLERVCFADQGQPVGILAPQKQTFSTLPAPLVLPQSETERILEQKLNALGHTLERGVTLTEFSEQVDCIELKLQHTDGKIEVLQVQWLAGCDGARSIVRKTLEQRANFTFTGYTEPTNFILADVEYAGDYQNNQIMVSWGSEGAVALFPVSTSILRIVAERKSKDETPPTLAEIQTLLDKNGPQGLTLSNPSWLSLFRVNERLASHFRHQRIFLLGDAAHVHSPAGGQGMNTGIQDAFNLGWKLAWLLKSPQKTALLDSYESERRPIAEAVIKEASQKLHFAMKQNFLLRHLKNLVLPLLTRTKIVPRKMLAEMSELFIEYKNSPLIIPNNSVPSTKRPGKKWLDLAPSAAFGTAHILVVQAKTEAELSAFKKTVTASFADLNLDIIETVSTLEQPNWYLIRPDQFIAAGGTLSSLEDLHSYRQALVS